MICLVYPSIDMRHFSQSLKLKVLEAEACNDLANKNTAKSIMNFMSLCILL